MTDFQFSMIIATVWVAPHAANYFGVIAGILIAVLALWRKYHD
jgi:hypothetical protein